MNSILVDSSAWIAYFRGDPQAKVIDNYIDANIISTNELILSELLPAIRLKKEDRLAELLTKVNKLPLKINWSQIRDYQYINLQYGLNKVGIPDLIIFQNAILNGATLATLDRHFQLMSKQIECNLMLIEI